MNAYTPEPRAKAVSGQSTRTFNPFPTAAVRQHDRQKGIWQHMEERKKKRMRSTTSQYGIIEKDTNGKWENASMWEFELVLLPLPFRPTICSNECRKAVCRIYCNILQYIFCSFGKEKKQKKKSMIDTWKKNLVFGPENGVAPYVLSMARKTLMTCRCFCICSWFRLQRTNEDQIALSLQCFDFETCVHCVVSNRPKWLHWQWQYLT